jgi:retinol-binding protein 3
MSIVALTAVLALAATEDTPAGQQLTAWLTAFNSTDPTTLLEYHDRHFPYSAASRDVADVGRELRLGRATGGFEVRKVEQLTAFSLTAYLKERRRPAFARVRLEVDSKPPYKVLSFEIGPVPPPDELLTPEERALATVNPAKRRRLLDGIARKLEAHYVYPEVAKRMIAAIQKHDADGNYDAITSAPLLADKLAGDLRSVSRDGHLRVMFGAPLPPPPGAAAAPPPIRAGFGFGPINRMEGNVAHVVLNGFVGDHEQVRQAIGGYMSQVADADALLLDLRGNGGGDPATVAVVASYFFDDKPVHLNDMYRRDTGETRQYWTHPKVAGKRFGAKKPIYVLTSSRTFSGGEELAYDLQSLRRAVIVGETTGGGAHPPQPYALADGFAIAVPWGRPINPVTKTNWEGTGVVPEVKVSESEALNEAHRRALAELRRRSERGSAQK